MQPLLKNCLEMDKFKEFSLPIKGLKNGKHEFDFEIGSDFFKEFESSPIEEGNFDVHLIFDKRDSFFELNFDFDGSIKTDCDRCTASIGLPFGGDAFLMVKTTIEPQEEDAEVVYISPDESDFNVAKYIYEFICLAIPFHKSYDCENDDPQPCDFDILNRLNPSVNEAKIKVEPKKNPFDDLKNIFNGN